MCKSFGWTSLSINYSSGAYGITSSLANLLARISPLLIMFSLITIYWLFYREQRRNTPAMSKFSSLNSSDAACIVKYSFLAILVLIITNKVLSPQYLIWLFPFIPLLTGPRKVMSWIIFIAIGVITYFIYPVFYDAIINGAYFAVGLLFVRNILLIVLACLVALKGREHVLKKENIVSRFDN